MYCGIHETKQLELELLVFVFTIIQPACNCKFTIQWYQNNISIF